MTSSGNVLLPHWERGHRGHGWWIGIQRIGYVGLADRGMKSGPRYSWQLDYPTFECRTGQATSLRQAKRAVERAYRERRSLEDLPCLENRC